MRSMDVEVWLSGENLPLAQAEATAVAALLGSTASAPPLHGRLRVQLPSVEAAETFSGRLALSHRCAAVYPALCADQVDAALRREGAAGRTAAFQWVAGTSATSSPGTLARLGQAYVAGGGSIDLRRPDRRFWVEEQEGGSVVLFEGLAPTARSGVKSRATPELPFQRPVTLPPRLARAVVNLAHIEEGSRVVDPFLGTGALLVEAALLGARTVGIDVDGAMVRGALRNFAYFRRDPESLRQADAADAAREFSDASFDALVTDPPYGRASGTRGEAATDLWRRTIRVWASRVRAGGRLAVVVPAGTEAAIPGTRLELSIPQRVHRSLTREFRVYVRD